MSTAHHTSRVFDAKVSTYLVATYNTLPPSRPPLSLQRRHVSLLGCLTLSDLHLSEFFAFAEKGSFHGMKGAAVETKKNVKKTKPNDPYAQPHFPLRRVARADGDSVGRVALLLCQRFDLCLCAGSHHNAALDVLQLPVRERQEIQEMLHEQGRLNADRSHSDCYVISVF